MTGMTVEMVKTPEGFDIVRSDEQRFFLVDTAYGHAVLYAGRRGKPPVLGIVDLDESVADKLEAAREHALSYRAPTA